MEHVFYEYHSPANLRQIGRLMTVDCRKTKYKHTFSHYTNPLQSDAIYASLTCGRNENARAHTAMEAYLLTEMTATTITVSDITIYVHYFAECVRTFLFCVYASRIFVWVRSNWWSEVADEI